MALATAIPVGELQALSRCFSFVRGDACLSFVHTFVTKCESLLVPSLAPSWLYRCPTLRLVSTYILCFALFMPSAFSWTGRLLCSIAPAVFFVSPRCPSRALSVTTVSFLLRVVFMLPVLPGLRLAPFAHMGSMAFLRDGRLLCLFFLCFLCFFVLCWSQPKKSCGVMLYGHMECRVPWVPPGFILALSRTLSLSSDW